MLLDRRIGVQANSRPGIQERLPQTLDTDVGHLHPARCPRIVQIGRRLHVTRIQDRDGEVRFRRMFPAVVGVAVIDDGSHVLRKVLHSTGNLNRKQVIVPPGTDPGLPLERLEQPVLVGNVCRDRDATLVAHTGEQIRERLIADVAGHRRLANTELSETTSQSFLREIRRIEAEYVYALGRGQLETRKNVDRAVACCGPNRRDPAHVIVVGHREHRDIQRHRLLDEAPGVLRIVHRRWRLAAVRARVVARIHLQGAPAELGAHRLAERGRNRIVPAHALPPAAGRSAHPRARVRRPASSLSTRAHDSPVHALDLTIPEIVHGGWRDWALTSGPPRPTRPEQAVPNDDAVCLSQPIQIEDRAVELVPAVHIEWASIERVRQLGHASARFRFDVRPQREPRCRPVVHDDDARRQPRLPSRIGPSACTPPQV